MQTRRIKNADIFVFKKKRPAPALAGSLIPKRKGKKGKCRKPSFAKAMEGMIFPLRGFCARHKKKTARSGLENHGGAVSGESPIHSLSGRGAGKTDPTGPLLPDGAICPCGECSRGCFLPQITELVKVAGYEIAQPFKRISTIMPPTSAMRDNRDVIDSVIWRSPQY